MTLNSDSWLDLHSFPYVKWTATWYCVLCQVLLEIQWRIRSSFPRGACRSITREGTCTGHSNTREPPAETSKGEQTGTWGFRRGRSPLGPMIRGRLLGEDAIRSGSGNISRIAVLLPCLEVASLSGPSPRLHTCPSGLCSPITSAGGDIFWPWKDWHTTQPTSLRLSLSVSFCPKSKFAQCRPIGLDWVRCTFLVPPPFVTGEDRILQTNMAAWVHPFGCCYEDRQFLETRGISRHLPQLSIICFVNITNAYQYVRT